MRPDDTLRLEVRHAVRRLSASPGFVLMTVLSLGLGIGVTTGGFSVLYAVFLRALPVSDPASLAVVSTRNDGSRYSMSYPAYTCLRDRSASLAGAVSFRAVPVNVSSDGATERVTGMLVSGDYFGVLGVTMTAGAPILPTDDQTPDSGGPRGIVAVLGHRFWMRKFAGGDAVLGRTIRINGQPVTVVGVAPRDFDGTRIGSLPDVFLPMMFASRVFESRTWLPAPRNHWLRIMARLKPGVTLEQAQAEMTVIFQRYQQDVIVPLANTDTTRTRARTAAIVLEPGYGGLLEMEDTLRPTLFSLMGLVAVVLLIACTNVAGLMAARAERLRRDTAICLALGATRERLWSRHFIETLIMSAAAMGLSLLVAASTARLFTRLAPAGQDLRVVLDGTVLALAMAVALMVTTVLTVLTARQSMRASIGGALKGDDLAGRLWLRKGLIAGQLGLSVVVLAAAALFVQTLANLRRVDTGFDRRGVLFASISTGGYSPDQRRAFFARLLEDVRAIPGVVSAATANDEPLDVRTGWGIRIQTDAAAAPRSAEASVEFISPGYFKTMNIPMVRGRDFDAIDAVNPIHSVIVNETFARAYLPGVDPLGARILGGSNGTYEIIGVVRNSAAMGLRDLEQHMLYVPGADGVLHVRAASPSSLQPAIEAAIHRLDPNIPVFNVRTIEQQIDRFMIRERTFAALASIFGLLAVVLCGVGVYGVVANAVSRRTKELGIRLALGAGPGRILRLVLQEAAGLSLLGVATGIPCVFLISEASRSLLFGVQPGDWKSVAAGVAVLLTVALLTAWLPARRASRIDPLTALRHE